MKQFSIIFMLSLSLRLVAMQTAEPVKLRGKIIGYVQPSKKISYAYTILNANNKKIARLHVHKSSDQKDVWFKFYSEDIEQEARFIVIAWKKKLKGAVDRFVPLSTFLEKIKKRDICLIEPIEDSDPKR